MSAITMYPFQFLSPQRETFSSQVCGATSLCLRRTATRTQSCRESVAIGSIPLVPQSGGFCFEVTVDDKVDERVERLQETPFRVAGAGLSRVLRRGALPRCGSSHRSRGCGGSPEGGQQLDGRGGTRAASEEGRVSRPG